MFGAIKQASIIILYPLHPVWMTSTLLGIVYVQENLRELLLAPHCEQPAVLIMLQ